MPVLEAPPSGFIRTPKTSNADCFSPRTDKSRSEAIKCGCGADAIGGVPVDGKQSVVNKAILLFRFLCATCRNDSTFAISTGMIYPSWKVVVQQEPGLVWLRHLNEKEIMERLDGSS